MPTLFWWAILTRNVPQTDLVSGMRSGFISRSAHARLQSRCAVVTICSTLVNIQTHTQMAFWPAYMKSSASWA